jgi:hypothetical protein
MILVAIVFASSAFLRQSILHRMQSAGAGTEGDVGAFRIFRQRLGAVPDARAAVDAFLAVEHRHATFTERDGLAAAPN